MADAKTSFLLGVIDIWKDPFVYFETVDMGPSVFCSEFIGYMVRLEGKLDEN
jgi:hypothetical protein